MPSQPRSGSASFRLAAVCVLALAALAACVGGPPRPTTPTYSGATRPDPSRPPRPGEPLPSEPVSERFADSRTAYMPRHIAPEQAQTIKRIAVLLPFNSTNAETSRIAWGLYNSIQMALFEAAAGGARDVILMPRDASSNDPRETANVAEAAIRDGAIAVIGPLVAGQVSAVASEAAVVHAPVFSFSTDASVIGQGAYLVSLTPRSEVERIVDWAAREGVTRFAMFGPDSNYGRTVETALREEAAERGAAVAGIEYYTPNNPTPQENAIRLSSIIKAENTANPGKVAVLIPEQGVQLRSVAPLLRAISGTTPKEVRFLGTGLWNDPSVWREPALYGGVFPAPDPAAIENFDRRYLAFYGEAPPRLASYGYDAGAMVARLASDGRLDAAMIQREQGWSGVNGLFRFLPDGSAERALAVRQLEDRGGVRTLVPPLQAFAAGS